MQRLLNLALLLCALPAYAQYSLQKFDINTTTSNIDPSSYPSSITDFNNKVYLVARDGINGPRLWWCDGISYGVVDNSQTIYKFVNDPIRNFGIVNGHLYYDAVDSNISVRKLFSYDGMHDPQQLPFIDTASSFESHDYVSLNGRLYFLNGRLWEYNPLSNSFNMISGVVPGDQLSSAGKKIIAYNGNLIVVGSTGSADDGLFEYDPALNSIQNLTQKYQSCYSPQAFNVYMGKLFLVARDDDFGRELYMYDGVNSPKRLTDIRQGQASTFADNTFTGYFGLYKGSVYFFINTGTTKLYKYDLQADHVSIVWDAGVSADPGHSFVVYGGRMYFSFTAGSNYYEGLYVYDGTSDPHLLSIPGQFVPIYPKEMTVTNGRLFFAGYDSTDGELYALTDSIALSVNTFGDVPAAGVYPNPATSVVHINFTLKSPAEAEIRLADMQGKIVYCTGIQHYSAAAHDIEISMHDCAVGNYLYSVTDAGGKLLYTGRVVKN